MVERFEERVRERERIARELHDTLLQSAQALLWATHALSAAIRPDDPMRRMLTDTMARADALMTQGRDRIQNLRAEGNGSIDLAQSLANAWRDLGGETKFSILVEGAARDLLPEVGDEIALIAREALANALRHANACAIEAQIVFGEEMLRLCLRDDGAGIGDGALHADALAGHWGLLGMEERAQRIGATLSIWSSPGAGTEVELIVLAGSVYAPSGASKPCWPPSLASVRLLRESTDLPIGR